MCHCLLLEPFMHDSAAPTPQTFPDVISLSKAPTLVTMPLLWAGSMQRAGRVTAKWLDVRREARIVRSTLNNSI